MKEEKTHERAGIPAQLGYPDWIRLQLMVELANPKHFTSYKLEIIHLNNNYPFKTNHWMH